MRLPRLQDRCIFTQSGVLARKTRNLILKNRARNLIQDPSMRQKSVLVLKQGWGGSQYSLPASQIRVVAPSEAAQSQQPQCRQLGWQGRGLRYGLHFLFAQAHKFVFFVWNQSASVFITASALREQGRWVQRGNLHPSGYSRGNIC